jgi:hypothetical protein
MNIHKPAGCGKEERVVEIATRRVLINLICITLALSILATAGNAAADQPQPQTPQLPQLQLPTPGAQPDSGQLPPTGLGQPQYNLNQPTEQLSPTPRSGRVILGNVTPGSEARPEVQPLPAAQPMPSGQPLPAAQPSATTQPNPAAQPATGYPTGTAMPNAQPNDASQGQSQGDADEGGASWNGGILGPGCSTAPCCEICGGGSGPPPEYFFEANTIVWTRSRAQNAPNFVFENIGNPSENPPPQLLSARLSFRDINSIIAPGLDGTISHYLGRDSENRDEFVEFSYWGLLDWRGTTSVVSEKQETVGLTNSSGATTGLFTFGNLFSTFPANLSGFNLATQATLTTQTDINNFEVNYRWGPRNEPDRLVLYPNGRWRRECRPGFYFSYMIGLRVIDMDDYGDYFSNGGYFTNEKGVETPVTGDYNVHTRNRLIGSQIGGEYTYRNCRWQSDVHAKVGGYLNILENNGSILTSQPINPLSSQSFQYIAANSGWKDSQDVGAIEGEFGVSTSYKFRPNLIGRASYDFMWVGGLALAPEQFRFRTDPQAQTDARGLLFMNGISIGLEYTW